MVSVTQGLGHSEDGAMAKGGGIISWEQDDDPSAERGVDDGGDGMLQSPHLGL